MVNNRNFSVLLCDLGNVIAFFDHHISSHRLSMIMGLPEEKLYNEVFYSDLADAFVMGHIDEHEFYSRLQILYKDHPFPSYEEFVNIWVMIFRPNHRMIEALDDLRGEVKMVMVSNTNPLHFKWIQTKFPQIISPFGDNLFLSYEQHCMKPQEKFFKKALEFAGAEPADCLFVDDVQQYVEAAAALGIRSVHYDDHRRFLHVAFPGQYTAL